MGGGQLQTWEGGVGQTAVHHALKADDMGPQLFAGQVRSQRARQVGGADDLTHASCSPELGACAGGVDGALFLPALPDQTIDAEVRIVQHDAGCRLADRSVHDDHRAALRRQLTDHFSEIQLRVVVVDSRDNISIGGKCLRAQPAELAVDTVGGTALVQQRLNALGGAERFIAAGILGCANQASVFGRILQGEMVVVYRVRRDAQLCQLFDQVCPDGACADHKDRDAVKKRMIFG